MADLNSSKVYRQVKLEMLLSLFWVTIVGVVSALPFGRKIDLTNGRIVGGEAVSIQHFPFQVSVQVGGSHNCGGSIISRNFVLTAGHCVRSSLTVRAGSNLTTEGGTLHQVVQTIRHENYSAVMVPKNDIALLRIKPPFKLDSTRQPIKLHTDVRKIKDGAPATVSGFGVTDSGWLSSSLRAVTVEVVNKRVCSRKYMDLGFPAISEDFICGGIPEGGKDSCQGDSGGPFIVDGRLAGIVSYGYKCAQPDVPGVYTNVAYFNSWIKNHTSVNNL